MGNFFTNVQIWRGAAGARAPRGQLVAAVADAVKQAAEADGYVEAGDGDEADRTILIAKTADGDPWLPIYDEATEGQDVRKLDALASQLSARLETIAVGVQMHDSDVLELRLFESGQLVDRYNNWPGYFGAEVSAREAAEAAGHPERWARLLRDSKTPADLGTAWREEAKVAEVVVSATAEVLGWDGQLAGTGYAHSADGDQVQPLLRLRWRERPQAERLLDGPPRFDGAGYTVEATFAVGEPLTLHHSVRNVGGASRGLLHVRFHDVDIPAGHDISQADMQRLGPRKAITLKYASNVSVALTGTATAPGAGKLCIGFVPHASPDEGQCGRETSIKVTASKKKQR